LEDIQDGPIIEDATEIEERERKLREEEEEERLKERSTVLRRNLPRPKNISKTVPVPEEINPELPEEQQAESLIAAEMSSIIYHDNVCFPANSKDAQNLTPSQQHFISTYEKITEEEMDAAAALLEEEIAAVREETHNLFGEVSDEVFLKAFKQCHNDLIYVPSTNKWIGVSRSTKKDRVASLTHFFELNLNKLKAQSQRAVKMEKKLQVLHGGYSVRSASLISQINEKYESVAQAKIELACFEALREKEQQGIQNRIAKLQNEVDEQAAKENRLQKTYANLVGDKELLLRAISSAPSTCTS